LGIGRISNTAKLHPSLLLEESYNARGSQEHDPEDDPEAVGIINEGVIQVLAKDVGNEHGGQHNDREQGEDAHDFIRFVGQEGVVGFFQGPHRVFVRLQVVFHLAPVTQEVREIGFHFLAKELGPFVFQRIKNITLGDYDAKEINNVCFGERDFLEHLRLLALEDSAFDLVELPVNARKLGKGAFPEFVEHVEQ